MDVQPVHVDVGDRLRQRIERAHGVVLPIRAAPALRPSPRGTGSIASAASGSFVIRARDLEDAGDADGVVDRAVVDRDRRSPARRRRDDPSAPCRRRIRPSASGRGLRASRRRSASRSSRSLFLIVIDAVTPSGTGLKSRVAACFFSVVEVLAAPSSADSALIEADPSLEWARGSCSCPAPRGRTARPSSSPWTTSNG